MSDAMIVLQRQINHCREINNEVSTHLMRALDYKTFQRVLISFLYRNIKTTTNVNNYNSDTKLNLKTQELL